MKQEEFVERYRDDWSAMTRYLADREGSAKMRAGSILVMDDAEFAGRYRQLCQQLALARRRHYSPHVVEQLHDLVRRGHHLLYRVRAPFLHRVLRFLAVGFPRAVRAQWRWVVAASVLFYLPMVAMALAVYQHPDLIYSVYDAQMVSAFEEMYDPSSERVGEGRDSEDDFSAFGFYVMNNAGIGMRTFGSGFFAGIGAAFILVFNGVMLGSVAGYLTITGSGEVFWPFVVGHSALELTAITIAGAAGLKLGAALVAPGQNTRRRAIRLAAEGAMPLVYGMVVMFLLAAGVEAFWSSIGWMPATTKYVAGAIGWVLVLGYLLRVGRGGRT